MRCIRRSNLHQNTQLRLVKGLTDTGYINNYYPLQFLHGKKGSNLTENEKIINAKISNQRGVIEKYFGRLKLMYLIFNDFFILDLIYF